VWILYSGYPSLGYGDRNHGPMVLPTLIDVLLILMVKKTNELRQVKNATRAHLKALGSAGFALEVYFKDKVKPRLIFVEC